MSPLQGATKWYPYGPNWKVGNDSPTGHFHCLGVCSMHTSKIREIKSELLSLCLCRMLKSGKVRVS